MEKNLEAEYVSKKLFGKRDVCLFERFSNCFYLIYVSEWRATRTRS